MTTFLSNIILHNENDIQFKNAAGTNTGKIEADGNDLVLSNAVGDILLGASANGGYTRHTKPGSTATALSYILSMDTAGNARWADVLDGGSF